MPRTKRLLVWHEGNVIKQARPTMRLRTPDGRPHRRLIRLDDMIVFKRVVK